MNFWNAQFDIAIELIFPHKDKLKAADDSKNHDRNYFKNDD